jgi:hypothetical protein
MSSLIARSKEFAKKVAATENVRDRIPAPLQPLFDHIIHEALQRYKRGYYTKAGAELKQAQALARTRSSRPRVRRSR